MTSAERGAAHTPTPFPVLRADHCRDKFPGQLDDPGYHQIITKIDGKRVVVADTLNRDARWSPEDDERFAAFIVEACNSHAALVTQLRKLLEALERIAIKAAKGRHEEDFDVIEAMALRAIRDIDAGHASDCALYNEPALPIGQCDCGKVTP